MYKFIYFKAISMGLNKKRKDGNARGCEPFRFLTWSHNAVFQYYPLFMKKKYAACNPNASMRSVLRQNTRACTYTRWCFGKRGAMLIVVGEHRPRNRLVVFATIYKVTACIRAKASFADCLQYREHHDRDVDAIDGDR